MRAGTRLVVGLGILPFAVAFLISLAQTDRDHPQLWIGFSVTGVAAAVFILWAIVGLMKDRDDGDQDQRPRGITGINMDRSKDSVVKDVNVVNVGEGGTGLSAQEAERLRLEGFQASETSTAPPERRAPRGKGWSGGWPEMPWKRKRKGPA